MKTILVDDESLALEYLEKLLNKLESFDIIGKYTNPHNAKRNILKEKPAIVFLDIEMPEINGIELAEQILQSLPKTHIVFVTAFHDYAVQAFELNAIDYVVKPVQLHRLSETLHRFQVKEVKEIASVSPEPINRICTFQSLSFTRITETTETLDVRWRTSKARGIFAFLLQHRNKYITKEALLELFWPEVDREKSTVQLYSTIYQIRKTLSSIQFNVTITNHENGYRLNLNEVQLDIQEWEDGLKENLIVNDDTFTAHQRLMNIYQGDYLSEEDLWAENERERLRVLYLQHISKVADYLVSKDEYPDAISLYLRVQMTAPYIDHSYFKLMQLYSKIRNLHAVEQQYTQLKNMLLQEYGVEPKIAIQDWYINWLKNVAIGD